MKYIAMIIMFALFVAACGQVPQEVPEDIQQQVQQDVEEVIAQLPDAEPEPIDDQTLYEGVEGSIDVVNGNIVADVSPSVEVDLSGMDISDACVAGQAFDVDAYPQFAEAGVTKDSQVLGMTTYEGNSVCHIRDVQVTPVAVEGVDDIETITDVYIAQDISKLWLEINVMGQVEKSEIVLQ